MRRPCSGMPAVPCGLPGLKPGHALASLPAGAGAAPQTCKPPCCHWCRQGGGLAAADARRNPQARSQVALPPGVVRVCRLAGAGTSCWFLTGCRCVEWHCRQEWCVGVVEQLVFGGQVVEAGMLACMFAHQGCGIGKHLLLHVWLLPAGLARLHPRHAVVSSCRASGARSTGHPWCSTVTDRGSTCMNLMHLQGAVDPGVPPRGATAAAGAADFPPGGCSVRRAVA